MIQRRQSLFLFFSAIIMIAYAFAPVIRVDGGGMHMMVAARDISLNVPFPVIGRYFVFVVWIAAWITAGINLLTIFLYRYRRVQVLFSWLSILPAIYCFCYIYYRMTTTEMTQDQLFYYGNISPIVAILFIFAAIYYIQKDEDLVKSVDRLR